MCSPCLKKGNRGNGNALYLFKCFEWLHLFLNLQNFLRISSRMGGIQSFKKKEIPLSLTSPHLGHTEEGPAHASHFSDFHCCVPKSLKSICDVQKKFCRASFAEGEKNKSWRYHSPLLHTPQFFPQNRSKPLNINTFIFFVKHSWLFFVLRNCKLILI